MRRILQIVFIPLFLAWGNLLANGIFVGSPSCPAPPGCPVFGNEVNGIRGNTYTLDQATGMPNASMTDPVLLIIGVPNVGGTFSAPSISISMGSASLGGTPPSGLAWNTATGFAGTMTSGGSITDAYQALGLSDPSSINSGNSENFANWSAADSGVLGLTATNFGVYVYELQNTGLVGHPSSVNVTFGGLPVGTFVAAYGCTSSFPCSGGNIYATPFTQAGLNVPEPATLLILATDLFWFVGLVFIARRRLRFSFFP